MLRIVFANRVWHVDVVNRQRAAIGSRLTTVSTLQGNPNQTSADSAGPTTSLAPDLGKLPKSLSLMATQTVREPSDGIQPAIDLATKTTSHHTACIHDHTGGRSGWTGWLRSNGCADHHGSADDRCAITSAKTLRCVSAEAVGVACLSWRTPGLSGQAPCDDLGQMQKPTADVHPALAVLSDRLGRLPHSRLIPHEAEFRAHRELFGRCLSVAVGAPWPRVEHVDV